MEIAIEFDCDQFIKVDPVPYRAVSRARNIGVQHGGADWLAFLDDDDIWLPTKLERQWQIVQTKKCDIIACDVVEFWTDGTEVIKRPRR
jgi:glycosyltransferase involved in cell wall biosynthesis